MIEHMNWMKPSIKLQSSRFSFLRHFRQRDAHGVSALGKFAKAVTTRELDKSWVNTQKELTNKSRPRFRTTYISVLQRSTQAFTQKCINESQIVNKSLLVKFVTGSLSQVNGLPSNWKQGRNRRMPVLVWSPQIAGQLLSHPSNKVQWKEDCSSRNN